MAYNVVFRKRVIEYKDAGHTFKEVEEAFGVDSKRYYSWKKQFEETGSLESKTLKERNRKINKGELLRLLDEHPDWYLREFAAEFNVCLAAIYKMFKKLGVSRKKTFTDSEKSEKEREEFLKQIAKIPEKKRVYVDECGINEHLQREYGRAVRGEKVEDTKRGRKFHRVNVVAAITHGKSGTKKTAPECYHGSMTGERFEVWFESSLLKNVKPGCVIIMDISSGLFPGF
jgi:transposase